VALLSGLFQGVDEAIHSPDKLPKIKSVSLAMAMMEASGDTYPLSRPGTRSCQS
jgi:hypothetical protein